MFRCCTDDNTSTATTKINKLTPLLGFWVITYVCAVLCYVRVGISKSCVTADWFAVLHLVLTSDDCNGIACHVLHELQHPTKSFQNINKTYTQTI